MNNTYNVSTTLYLVFRNPGPAWLPGLPTRQQPLWDEHAVFIDRLFDRGRIVLAGPYADCSLLSSSCKQAAQRRHRSCFVTIPGPGTVFSLTPRLSNGLFFSIPGRIPEESSTIAATQTGTAMTVARAGPTNRVRCGRACGAPMVSLVGRAPPSLGHAPTNPVNGDSAFDLRFALGGLRRHANGAVATDCGTSPRETTGQMVLAGV